MLTQGKENSKDVWKGCVSIVPTASTDICACVINPQYSSIVTGGGNGIGLSIVEQLLASGSVAHVVAVDLDAAKLEPLREGGGGRLSIVVGDVADESVNDKAVEMAVQATGRLTTLILNAATFRPVGPLVSITSAQWKRTFDINFFSVVHMLRAAWPRLVESQGTVLVTSTRLSQKPSESWACYSCTKAVLNYLCSCIPLEDPRLRCVAVTPGAVDTDMQAQMRNDGMLARCRPLGSMETD